ncbi:MAG: hypothetical protein K2K10_05185, partial [Acetatifactor sp.]|nr:hypothetical protein [Acetatifactor sp.]
VQRLSTDGSLGSAYGVYNLPNSDYENESFANAYMFGRKKRRETYGKGEGEKDIVSADKRYPSWR